MSDMDTGATVGSSEGTGFETIQIVLIVLVMIFIAGFVFSIYAIKYINNNWQEYRCQPLYMMIAGLIGHDPDENHTYCQKNLASQSASEMTKKMDEDNDKRNTIANTLQSLANEMVYKINSVDSVHNQATKGIMTVINNFKATIMFMMEKLKVIIKKLLAIATVIIYTLFSSVIFMKSMINGTLGGLDTIVCFAKDTIIYNKPIQDLELKDHKNILAVMEFDYPKDYIYEYNGTKVTEDHLVLEDKWIKVKDSKNASKIPFNDSKVYCLVTKDNKIHIGNTVFSDFISVSGETNYIIKNSIIEKLQSKCPSPAAITGSNKSNYYESGLIEDSIINTSQGDKYIKNIKVGDILPYYGRVIGIVKQKNTNWVKINGSIIASEQIILNNDQWIKASGHPDAKEYTHDGVAVSINTQMGMYTNNHISLLQYSEIESNELENLTQDYLNRSIKVN
jgi:hypothetical protein